MSRLVVIALVFVSACATRSVDEDAGATTMVGGESTSDAHDGSSEVGPLTLGTTGDGDGDGDGDTGGDGDGDTGGDGDGDGCMEPSKLDLPPDFENTQMPDSCSVETIDWQDLGQYPGCELCEFENYCFSEVYLGCATPGPGQTCADICPSGDCLTTYWNACEGGDPWMDEPTDTCGYYEIDGKCCTVGKFLAGCAE